jgi:predicted aspartyl protease
MKSLADGLPSEIAQQVHPDWRKNEAAYWAVRDELLSKYRNQWIGFSGGRVVASGSRPVVVFHAALDAAEHPFFVCVGREYEPFRMRRTSFAFDATYPGQSLPVIHAEFRQSRGVPGMALDRVIPDTGADTTTLPWKDCQSLNLNLAHGVPGFMSGIAGGSATTFAFRVWVYLDGNEYGCQLFVDFHGSERILGRDVLNSPEILFRGPSGEVVVNP